LLRKSHIDVERFENGDMLAATSSAGEKGISPIVDGTGELIIRLIPFLALLKNMADNPADVRA
jgi:hypothetical protein